MYQKRCFSCQRLFRSFFDDDLFEIDYRAFCKNCFEKKVMIHECYNCEKELHDNYKWIGGQYVVCRECFDTDNLVLEIGKVECNNCHKFVPKLADGVCPKCYRKKYDRPAFPFSAFSGICHICQRTFYDGIRSKKTGKPVCAICYNLTLRNRKELGYEYSYIEHKLGFALSVIAWLRDKEVCCWDCGSRDDLVVEHIHDDGDIDRQDGGSNGVFNGIIRTYIGYSKYMKQPKLEILRNRFSGKLSDHKWLLSVYDKYQIYCRGCNTKKYHKLKSR